MGPFDFLSDVIFASPTLTGFAVLAFAIGAAWIVEQVRAVD